jgi:hypothetical protein
MHVMHVTVDPEQQSYDQRNVSRNSFGNKESNKIYFF